MLSHERRVYVEFKFDYKHKRSVVLQQSNEMVLVARNNLNWMSKALFSSKKIVKFFRFSSHRISRHVHIVLNIDENKN
jgi:hypothetical protein